MSYLTYFLFNVNNIFDGYNPIYDFDDIHNFPFVDDGGLASQDWATVGENVIGAFFKFISDGWDFVYLAFTQPIGTLLVDLGLSLSIIKDIPLVGHMIYWILDFILSNLPILELTLPELISWTTIGVLLVVEVIRKFI